jgi:hypothetical protein
VTPKTGLVIAQNVQGSRDRFGACHVLGRIDVEEGVDSSAGRHGKRIEERVGAAMTVDKGEDLPRHAAREKRFEVASERYRP